MFTSDIPMLSTPARALTICSPLSTGRLARITGRPLPSSRIKSS
ncbi:Uncharacterised protein [Vibrio cholerae]|nr:Uncharacterised protein [Vibrio cholerae]